jgi:hypothetical protein
MQVDLHHAAAIATYYPELAAANFETSTAGWDSLALIGGGMVFKFPRNQSAAEKLRREAQVLAILRPRVRMPLPELMLHRDGQGVFSAHAIIPGGHLLPKQYLKLENSAKAALAEDIAYFFADVHAIDPALFRGVGAMRLPPWPSINTIGKTALPLLPTAARAHYQGILDAYAALPPDPLGEIFGMFDCHGWNMAFDHQAQRLNGLYDFGDCGFGPLHLEFMTVGKVAHTLALRVAGFYGDATGRVLDTQRIRILSGMNRIIEITEESGNMDTPPEKVETALKWLEETQASGV